MSADVFLCKGEGEETLVTMLAQGSLKKYT